MHIWLGPEDQPSITLNQLATRDQERITTQHIKDLSQRIARLTLINQALWELIRDRLQLTDTDLEHIMEEIDLRDGVKDGMITNTPLQCPKCGRISNSRHWKCLYCGLEFEKPLSE